jgi:hypothetical protein
MEEEILFLMSLAFLLVVNGFYLPDQELFS